MHHAPEAVLKKYLNTKLPRCLGTTWSSGIKNTYSLRQGLANPLKVVHVGLQPEHSAEHSVHLPIQNGAHTGPCRLWRWVSVILPLSVTKATCSLEVVSF